MAIFSGVPASDASTIDAVTRRLADSPRPERLRPIGLRHIVQGPDVLDGLPELVRSLAVTGPVLVLADGVPMERDGVDLKGHVLELLRRPGRAPRDHRRWQPRGARGHGDRGGRRRPRWRAPGAWCRSARAPSATSARRRRRGPDPIPYIVVQTACSVNAFSDDMAVLLIHGAKRTLPSRWPDALVIDLGVIADAPPILNQAGVGELSSMFTAPADWRLADMLGLDAGYDEAVVGLFRDDGEELERVAIGVAAG